LIVEVDGSQHVENEYDSKRDAALAKHGYRTLRFWNNVVLRDIESVCEAIYAAVQGANCTVYALSPSSVSFAATFSLEGEGKGFSVLSIIAY